MFDSCMDEDKIEILDAQPLLDLIKDYGSWNVTDGNWTDEKWTFMDNLVKIHKYLSIAPLFNMYVSADLKDSTKNVIVVSFFKSLIDQARGHDCHNWFRTVQILALNLNNEDGVQRVPSKNKNENRLKKNN